MNKGIFIGNLVRDPETRTTSGGESFTTFTIAVNRRTADGGNAADYIDCTAFGALAGICRQYLAKGKKVMVEGRISARAWSSRDGAPRAGLSLSVREMEMLSPKGAPAEEAPAPADGDGFVDVGDDEDLPF